MWDKSTRKVIFLHLYNYLFWDSLDPVSHADNLLLAQDISKVTELDLDLSKVSLDFIQEQLEIFKQKRPDFENQLKSSLSNWNQTYRIVKSILFAFLLESDWIKINDVATEVDVKPQKVIVKKLDIDSETQSKIANPETGEVVETDLENHLLGKYLRLSQEYGNSQSVAVVHAVLAKLSNSKNS